MSNGVEGGTLNEEGTYEFENQGAGDSQDSSGYNSNDAGSYAAIIGEIGNIAQMGITTIYNIALQQANPCQAITSIDNWDANIWRPNYLRAITRARNIAYRLPLAITEAIQSGGTTEIGGKSLASFLIENLSYTPASLITDGANVGLALTVAPFGPVPLLQAQTAWIQQRIPRPAQLLDPYLIPVDEEATGYTQGGIPMVGEEGSRRYIGSEIRDAVIAWQEYQTAHVVPARHSQARQRLTALVGTWQGSGEWGVWSPPRDPMRRYKGHDPIPPGFFNEDIACAVLYDRFGDYETISAVGGDGVSASSKIGEIVRLRLYKEDLKRCLTLRCQQQGGVQVIDPLSAVDDEPTETKEEAGDDGESPPPVRVKVFGNGDDDTTEQEQKRDPMLWVLGAAVAVLLITGGRASTR